MGRSDTNSDPAGLMLDNILSHYGVKGMRWGVRRRSGPKEPPSPDAARAAMTKQRAKRSGTKALSNIELQEVINRMNLVQQYKRLKINERNPVSRFVASLLLDVGKQQVSTVVREQVSSTISRSRSG